jgi:tetratricopeptide (TPR) repeat protein
MTRQQWACLVGHKLQNEHVMDWRDLVRYEPLKNRTSDVEAANLDEAIQLFRSGLRRARHGHVDQAVPLIACAYLLDSRAIEFVPFLPHNDHEGAAYYFMDMVLLQRLVDFDRGHNFGSQVLMIYSAIRFGHLNRSTNGRMRIMQALVLSDRLIKAVFDDKSIETPERGVLGGCMKRTTLHRMRCSLYIALQNTSKAIQELSMALRIDPSLASIRCARACLYASLNDRDTIMAAQEFRQFIADCHPDSTELPLAYAWLAKLLMDNSKLGTYSQAKDYWKKSRRAAHRYMKLYGEESGSQIEKEMFDCFSSIEPTATFESSESEEETTGDELDNEQPCMGCARKDNKEGGNIFQCSRCKQVHYCSTDWQQQVSPTDRKCFGIL